MSILEFPKLWHSVSVISGSCHRSMARSQVIDVGTASRFGGVAADILNKQLRTAEKGWSSSLGVG